MDALTYKLETFEGPLDLLLSLISKVVLVSTSVWLWVYLIFGLSISKKYATKIGKLAIYSTK